MRRFLLLGLAALPLLGFDCGGSDPAPYGPSPCTITVAGEVSEELWCIVALVRPNPAMPDYLLDVAAYRSMDEVGVGIGIDFPAKPALGAAYGWNAAGPSLSVTSGSATRYDSTYATTHEAMAMAIDWLEGSLSVTFSAVPSTDVGPDTVNVHGTLTASLPSTMGGQPVTLTARF